MSKLCYVIMPYGGSDEQRKKRFKSIFSAIIKPAAESKGYTVVREDHEARQGNIGANIIKSLAEADIVIADLSENNWNVAYELGIRHALTKNGTILIIDNETPLMFDIQGNKVITYSKNWYECIDETQQSIVDSIEYLENNHSSSDSPVHDIYTKFPVRLTDYLTNNNDKEKQKIAALTEENRKLREVLDNAGLSADKQIERADISASFKDALSRSQYSGKKALIMLQNSLDDEEAFVNNLAKIMSKGYLSESDCSRIYWMCKRLDNYFVTIAFLEETLRRYPESGEFSGRLAREYAYSSENRDKAIITVNKNIGVKKSNDKYIVEKKLVTYNVLAAFFDVYIALDKYSEMKEIATLLLDVYPAHAELIKRNIITSYRGLGEYDMAEQFAKELVASSPSAINHHSLYKVYRDSDRDLEAYEQIEKCIALEPDDKDYPMFAAGLIIDTCYVRTKTAFGSEICKLSKKQAAAATVPFVFEAYANKRNTNDCIDFLQRNDLNEAAAILLTCAKQGMSEIPRSEEFDYYALDYCLTKAE